jgi:transposase
MILLFMSNFKSYERDQPLLMPIDLREWVAGDDLVHFITEAAERVDISAFHVSRTGAGKAQYHPRMMLALLVYCYANGIFSSRRIEQATHRHISVRYITANTHPDHDTIAQFRRTNAAAFRAAFAQILMLAGETGLLKVGMVSVDGTKIDANASKIKSLRYDRIQSLRAQLEADISELMARAERADGDESGDGQTLPEEISRRAALKTKLDAAAKRLEDRARGGSGSNPDGDPDDPSPPPQAPKPDKQTNLTDPDSAIMRKSARHEYRQAYNAQAIVDADGSQLVLGTNVLGTSNDRAGFEGMIDALCAGLGKPDTLLADAGYASEKIVTALAARGIDPLVAISRGDGARKYDFRPPPKHPKPSPNITAQWRLEMQKKLQTENAKEKYRKRKSTVEPVFGIIKSVLGFTRFHLRGIENVKTEWTLVALAYNCKRMAKLTAA